MQDRFRFRAFNIYSKKMYYDVQDEYDYCINYGGGCANYFGELLENKDYVVMQCTGLKDKNDNLIYEGDILKQCDGILDSVSWSNGCYLHNGTAITNYDYLYQGDPWAKEAKELEIIGNIYENPELL